jgi:UDP-glucose 4-epimerase
MHNRWDGRKVLVTGGAGFVGSHLVDALLKLGSEVTVFDNLSTGFHDFVNSDAKMELGDCRDILALKEVVAGQEFVFHLAAHADVRRNMQNPRAVWQNNVDATLNVLTCMRAAHVNNLAFASSGIVYCGKGSKETDPLDADSIYGASKIAGEHLIKAFQLETGMHAWRFRFAGLLGPRYTHGHVADFVHALQQHPDHLTVLGDGRQNKAYLDVRDCVRGMLDIVDDGFDGASNLTGGQLVIRDSVRIVCETMGLSPRVTYGDTAGGWPTDPPEIELSSRRAIELSRPIGESVADTVRDLVSRQARHSSTPQSLPDATAQRARRLRSH